MLNYMSRNLRHVHKIIQPQNYGFKLIEVSVYTYTFIFIPDRTPRTLLLSLICLNMHADKTITQTIFVVQFTSGSFPHLGRPLDALSDISLRYSSATSFPLTVLSHYRYNPMGEFEFFPRTLAGEGRLMLTSGGIWTSAHHWANYI